MWKQKVLVLSACVCLTSTFSAAACDLCGCYTPQVEAMPSTEELTLGQPVTAPHESWSDQLYAAVAEQFTYFNTVQIDGREVANPTDQYLASSVTQLVLGYSFNSRVAVQLNVPLIYRSFQRPEGFRIDHGTESGLGDMSILGKFILFHFERGAERSIDFAKAKSPQMRVREPDFTFSAVLLGGVKFPTGSPARIKEEFDEVEIPNAPESGIHGHDLTLGTGSYDGLFGGQMSMRYRSGFFEADTQFTLRSEGAYHYRFANDLSWSGGPGYYFVRRPNAIVGLQCVCSGEHKDVDRFRGALTEDTGITSVYIGPRVVASFGKFSAEFGAELPVSIDNTALQVVPDYRLRASVAVRF